MMCILLVFVRLLATSFLLGCGGLVVVVWWWDRKRILPIECIYPLHFAFREKTNSGDLVVVSRAGVWC